MSTPVAPAGVRQAVEPLLSRAVLLGSGGQWHRPSPTTHRATVTVVVPCYNYGRYLETCTASVLDQQHVDVDVIVVDDCSTDDSAAVAEALADRIPAVRVIRHHRNRGHIATYNEGLAAATGTYVVLLSADDLLTPGSLDRAAALLDAHPSVGFAYGPCARFSTSAPPVNTQATGWITWRGQDWLATRCRSGYNVIASPEVVMRTSVLRRIGGYRPDLPHSGDFEMWLRAATVADVGYVAGAHQALYRVHEQNMHKTVFASGGLAGQLIDLEQRAESFTAAIGRPTGAGALPKLARTAGRTLAAETLDMVIYAAVRGVADFPVERCAELARRLDPEVVRTARARALARHARSGRYRRLARALWAPRAAGMRLEERGRRWRRWRVGI